MDNDFYDLPRTEQILMLLRVHKKSASLEIRQLLFPDNLFAFSVFIGHFIEDTSPIFSMTSPSLISLPISFLISAYSHIFLFNAFGISSYVLKQSLISLSAPSEPFHLLQQCFLPSFPFERVIDCLALSSLCMASGQHSRRFLIASTVRLDVRFYPARVGLKCRWRTRVHQHDILVMAIKNNLRLDITFNERKITVRRRFDRVERDFVLLVENSEDFFFHRRRSLNNSDTVDFPRTVLLVIVMEYNFDTLLRSWISSEKSPGSCWHAFLYNNRELWIPPSRSASRLLDFRNGFPTRSPA